MTASRRCVLAVANDPAERAALIQALRAAGYSVVSAVTFTGALELLSTTPPDVLISDVRLREFNGLHLALYARDYLVKGTIVMGTPADVPLADEATRLGAVFLVKPVDLAEVCMHVSMILEPQPDTGLSNRSQSRARLPSPRRVAVSSRPTPAL